MMHKEVIVKKIQEVLDYSKTAPEHSDCSNFENDESTTMHNTRLFACINNFSPRNSSYIKTASDAIKQSDITNTYTTIILKGILKGLQLDIESGSFNTFEEIINGDIFSDFIEMAEYFLKKNYKDPAAVIAGGVLEEHLRKLSLKNDLPVKNGKDYIQADTLNTSLRTNNVYNLVQDKIIIGWLGIRNKAAHGDYHEYDKSQVNSFIEGLLVFINNFPA